MNTFIGHTGLSAERIRVAFGQSAVGNVLVAASDVGVAAILLGDDWHALTRELARAFPAAVLICEESALADTVAKVVAFLELPQGPLDLPLDIRGSALQRAVWQALRDVPAGRTISYGGLARALPLPATAKEVGAACAANVLAVAIPYHRVVKADGAISGYRWGVQRKRDLIAREHTQ